MSALSTIKARISNRLSRDFCITPFRLANPGPMVSFTFDDAPVSASTTGATLLEQYKARGTFYIAGGLADQWSGNWTTIGGDAVVDLDRRGHEIGCHTFSHARTSDLSTAGLADEIDKNRRYLQALVPAIRLENFAYPYGFGSVMHKGQLKQSFRSSRGIFPGINSGTVDLQYLRSIPLIDRHIDRDGIDRAFEEAIQHNGWLIFYSHDVAKVPSPYGCSPWLLRHALEVAMRQKIPALTVAEALRFAGA